MRLSFTERMIGRVSGIPVRHSPAMTKLITQLEFCTDVLEAWIPLLGDPRDRAVAIGLLNAVARNNPRIKEFYVP